MEDVSALARPYGLAAFKQAEEEGNIQEWSNMLQLLVRIMQDATMRGLIANPKVNDQQVAELIIGVGGDGLSKTGGNLVRLIGRERTSRAKWRESRRYFRGRSVIGSRDAVTWK